MSMYIFGCQSPFNSGLPFMTDPFMTDLTPFSSRLPFMTDLQEDENIDCILRKLFDGSGLLALQYYLTTHILQKEVLQIMNEKLVRS